MRFEVLGPVRVTGAWDATPVAGTVRVGLLALLLARANAPVPAETLLDELWAAADPADRQRLQLTVHRLRRALGDPGRVEHDGGGYVLRIGPGELDAQLFDDAVARAESTDDPDVRVDLLRPALELWRGSPFQGLDLGPLAAETGRLTERREAALEQLYAAELERGRHACVVADLAEAVRRHPLRERLHMLLMTALSGCGRQADALAAYRSARRTLVDELGLEPGPELRDAERRILAGECDAPPARPGAAVVAESLRPPAQLPHDPCGFAGRDDELAALDRASRPATGGAAVVAVTGTAGVGKTALVTRWGHRARERFPDGQLHLDLYGFSPHDPVTAHDALGMLLRSLGERPDAVPADLDARAARFRTLTDGRRLLVVLDNAAGADQVRPLLPGSAACVTVVTSRDALAGLTAGEGAARVDVGRMSLPDARALLGARLGVPLPAGASRAVDDLVERCARLPLALRVAAERLRGAGPDGVAHLVAALGVERDRLDLLDTGDRRTSVRSVLSWSYRQLAPEQALLFRRSGFHCAHSRHYLDPFCASALLGSTDLPRTRRLIDGLVRCRLLDEAERGRYEMHDLLRIYAAELAAEQEDAEVATRRILDYYLAAALSAVAWLGAPRPDLRTVLPEDTLTPPLDGPGQALRWLDAERSALVCATEQALALGHPAHAVDLAATLRAYLADGGHRDEARRVHATASAAARELDDTDRHAGAPA